MYDIMFNMTAVNCLNISEVKSRHIKYITLRAEMGLKFVEMGRQDEVCAHERE